jgi:hypothetical protein
MTKTSALLISCALLFGCEREILTSDYNYCPVVASSGVGGDASLLHVWQRHAFPLDVVVEPGFSCDPMVLDEGNLFWETAFGYPVFRPAIEGPWEPDTDLSGGKVFIRFSSNPLDFMISQVEGGDVRASAQTKCWMYDGVSPRDTLNCGVVIGVCDWRIVAHELGHVLGFGSDEMHSTRPNDIMNATIYRDNDNYSISSTEKDLLAFWCAQ